MKVYVVLYHAEWRWDESVSEILGVFSNYDDAHKCMEDDFEDVFENVWDAEEEDTEINKFDNTFTLFDVVGNIDYVKWEIVEKEVK